MPARFVAEISFDEATVVIGLKGVLDARTSPCLETMIDTIVDRVGGLAFDVTELWSLDASGYAVLLRCINSAEAAGTPVSLRGMPSLEGQAAGGRRLGLFSLPDIPLSTN